MSRITLTYTKTDGHKMAYNQFTRDEFDDIDDLIDDANKEILRLKRKNEILKNGFKKYIDKFEAIKKEFVGESKKLDSIIVECANKKSTW